MKPKKPREQRSLFGELIDWLLAPLLPRFLAHYPTIQVDLRLNNETIETLSPGRPLRARLA